MPRADDGPWPPFPTDDWPDTQATLHMWSQIVGKVKLAFCPPVNHWWGVALHLNSRGITTGPIPHGPQTFDLTFDFIDHVLRIEISDGRRQSIALVPRPVADFYAQVMGALQSLRIDARIWPMPVEIPSPVRFDRDTEHASYAPDSVNRWWRIQLQVATAMDEFRGRFVGKCSGVLFWWGSFDLAVTRFSGRRAPERPDADVITREGYSHEVISAGFWPGSGALKEPAFYAYAAPEPPGFKAARIRPAAAFYSHDFGEFLLNYDDVRRMPSPRTALLEFMQSTYEAGATLAGWNRTELERPPDSA
jgi:hypothetical protein